MKLEIADIEAFKPILKPLLKEVVTEVMQELKKTEPPVWITMNKAAQKIGKSNGYVRTLIKKGILETAADGVSVSEQSCEKYNQVYGSKNIKI